MVSSETSTIRTQTPGNYPKRNKLHLEHGGSLKTRIPNILIFPYILSLSFSLSLSLSLITDTLVGLLCMYCVIILCVSLLPHVYCFTLCVLLSYILQLPDCWLEVIIRKVLRPATSAKVLLGFPVSKSECWDGPQHSKLLLHASHVALPT